MAHAPIWKSRPVFITSTFQDMQAERDHLREIVFPALEERLKELRHHLEWIDLRVGAKGVAEENEETRELQVLKVCLAEVKRSRPFLIGLIGDRYGWIPPEDRAKAAAQEEGFAQAVEGRSVTDLEIAYGVLADPDQKKRSFFYFRAPLPYDVPAQMSLEVAAQYSDAHDPDPKVKSEHRAEKLLAQKALLRTALPDHHRDYDVTWVGKSEKTADLHVAWDGKASKITGLEAWGKQVEEDIWRQLVAEIGEETPEANATPQDVERLALVDFAEDRARDFLGRKDVLAKIEALIGSPAQEGVPWGLCLTGPAGSGKSAVISAVHQGLTGVEKDDSQRMSAEQRALYARLKEVDAVVIGHAAGASPQSPSVDAMLRRWIGELAEFLKIDPGLPDNAKPDEVEAVFASLLGRAALKKRVIVLVDALDQFEPTPRGLHASWLPRLWHENARLIATAIPGPASEALAKRPGIAVTSMPPLDQSEARRIAEAISSRYHRTLPDDVLDALLADTPLRLRAWENPLWLVLAAEELNLVDADSFTRAARDYAGIADGNRRMRALMRDMAKEFPAAIPDLYQASFARAAKLFGMPLAAAFLGTIAVGRAGWRESDFRAVLPKLRGEAWDGLRFANLRRFFRGQLRQRGANGQWDFTHAQMRPAVKAWLKDVNGISETVLHTALGDHLLALQADDPLHVNETMVHLMAGDEWERRAAFYYGAGAATLAEAEAATKTLAALVTTAQSSEMAAALHTFERLMANTEIPEKLGVNVAIRCLSAVMPFLQYTAPTKVREELATIARTTLSRIAGTFPDDLTTIRGLVMAWKAIGEAKFALGHTSESIDAYRSGLKIISSASIKTTTDELSFDKFLLLSGLGKALHNQGNVKDAYETFCDCHKIIERLAQSHPNDREVQAYLADSCHTLGPVLVVSNRRSEAEAMYRRSASIYETLLRLRPENTAWKYNYAGVLADLGRSCIQKKNYTEAMVALRKNLGVLESLRKVDPENIPISYQIANSSITIGSILFELLKPEPAFKEYLNALEIATALVKRDPGNAGLQLLLASAWDSVGNARMALGDFCGAIEALRVAIRLGEELVRSDPEDMAKRRELSLSWNNIGVALREQGDIAAALAAFESCLDIRLLLVRGRAGNPVYQSDLYLTYVKIADAACLMGQFQKAKAVVERALEVTNFLVNNFPGFIDGAEYIDTAMELKKRSAQEQTQQVSVPTDQATMADTTVRPQEALQSARSALMSGNAQQAQLILHQCGDKAGLSGEMWAVCQMRLGKPLEAVKVLQVLLFPKDESGIAEGTPCRLVANYATAQLLTGDIRSARNTLNQVWDKDQPAISRLLAAIDKWEQSLSFKERMTWRFGGVPKKPFHLDPPYGEI